MTGNYQPYDHPVGDGVVLGNPRPNVTSRCYLADRPGHTGQLRAAELYVEFTITLAHPVRVVWPFFKDFNLWMNRFGYFWNTPPADREDSFAHLRNRPDANDFKWGKDEAPVQYVIRKVIPERLLYFDSQPLPMPGKDGVWSGHNVMSLYEEDGKTTIVVLMEHTFYSETMSIEELRADTKELVDAGLNFWGDYFIPDLIAAVEAAPLSKA